MWRAGAAGASGAAARGGGEQGRLGTGPKAGAEPGAHAWHGQRREGLREEGALPGPVIPGPLADSAVAAEKCPAAGGAAPGPAPTRGRGRGRAVGAVAAPARRCPARAATCAPNPLPTCCSRPWLPSAVVPLPAGLTWAGPRSGGAPGRPPALTRPGVPRRPCPPAVPGRSPGQGSSGTHLAGDPEAGGSLGGGAPAAAPRLPHCLRRAPGPLLARPASPSPRRSLPSPAAAAGRSTGHMLRGHKLGRSANTPVPGWLF